MKLNGTIKPKILLLCVLLLFIFFFSSDFGLIDVEKTSIITAIAVDKANDEYLITAQVAVPEANNSNIENSKAQISSHGSTIGGAINELGDNTGWFPKLAFCNLIILGDSFKNEDVVNALDFFAKTLRVQDSALVAMADGSAKELLSYSTPLDNISSFALQKIMFKNAGFDKAICSTDLKTFFEGHYSFTQSAYMPIIKPVPVAEQNENDMKNINKPDEKINVSDEIINSSDDNHLSPVSGSDSNQKNDHSEKRKNALFDARNTVLFKNGKYVGFLDQNETMIFNAFTSSFTGTTIPVNDVPHNDKYCNYLLRVLSNKSNIKVKADQENMNVFLTVNLYCKIIDVNTDGSDDALAQNKPVPDKVIAKAQANLTSYVNSLVKKTRDTQCDFMCLKQKLYRFNHKQYNRYKDNYLDVFTPFITVNVHGQR